MDYEGFFKEHLEALHAEGRSSSGSIGSSLADRNVRS
jgi:hypothetical protein